MGGFCWTEIRVQRFMSLSGSTMRSCSTCVVPLLVEARQTLEQVTIFAVLQSCMGFRKHLEAAKCSPTQRG